jgi:hypothetical protein
MYLFAGSPEFAQAANALEAARSHLKGLRDWNFFCLLVCTFAVGAGLLMELPEIIHDLCEIYGRKSRERTYWLTPSIDRKEYPRRDWVKIWSALGWILIVVGVTGEGVFESYVSKYDSALSNLTDTVVAEAQKEAAVAVATAKGFDARIAESDAKAKSADATAKQFESQIAQANERAAKNEKEAEDERTARVLIEQSLAPRSLTPHDEEAIAIGLIGLSGQRFSVAHESGNAEAESFAWDIARALDKAKQIVFAPNSIMDFSSTGIPFKLGKQPERHGVVVTNSGTEADNRPGKALVAALNECGFDATFSSEPSKNAASATTIFVEMRPKGPQGEARVKLEDAKKKQLHTTNNQ